MQLVYAYDSTNRPAVRRAAGKYDLCVFNCGHFYKLNTALTTLREKGYNDYQLIYVESGKLTFIHGLQEHTVCTGQLLVYPPNTRQEYTYHPTENSSYYWMHFDGCDIAQSFPFIESQSILTPKYSGFIAPIIEKMIQEITVYGEKSAFYTEAMGLELLYKLNREIGQIGKSLHSDMVREVIRQMKETPEQHSVVYYAKQYQFNTNYFIRLFKKETGLTPNQYRLNILIDKAKKLLLKSNLNIGEIAEMLNFDDPLYLSHVFKNRVGISPSEYRKRK